MLKEERKIDKRLYDFAAGCYCGVIMPEKVMKKITKLNAKFSSEIRKILDDHKELLYASEWTLANKMNSNNIEKQVTIRYVMEGKNSYSVEDRIALFKAPQPVYYRDVFLVKSREEAEQIAEEVLQEVLEDEK